MKDGIYVINCKNKEEWDNINQTDLLSEPLLCEYDIENNCIRITIKNSLFNDREIGPLSYYKDQYLLDVPSAVIIDFEEWQLIKTNKNEKIEKQTMEKLMLDVLEKTYDNPILRRTTVPLFMSNPGVGKTTIIKKFAETKGVNLRKITLSQRMPNEVVGGLMPDKASKTWEVYDSHELSTLKDGDILFFDEVFNGTLKQTLDAFLNLLEDRTLPSGTKLADILIVAASNPQGLINMTPQIKDRFIRYDLKFSNEEFQALLKQKYGMPETISKNLCVLVTKEKFEHESWNLITPRSIEKAINQIGCDLESPYNDVLLPFLTMKIETPVDIEVLNVKKGEEIEYLQILKLIIKNDNKNIKQKSGITSDLLS